MACGNLCYFCPGLTTRSRMPVKRYKKILAEIFPRAQVWSLLHPFYFCQVWPCCRFHCCGSIYWLSMFFPCCRMKNLMKEGLASCASMLQKTLFECLRSIHCSCSCIFFFLKRTGRILPCLHWYRRSSKKQKETKLDQVENKATKKTPQESSKQLGFSLLRFTPECSHLLDSCEQRLSRRRVLGVKKIPALYSISHAIKSVSEQTAPCFLVFISGVF